MNSECFVGLFETVLLDGEPLSEVSLARMMGVSASDFIRIDENLRLPNLGISGQQFEILLSRRAIDSELFLFPADRHAIDAQELLEALEAKFGHFQIVVSPNGRGRVGIVRPANCRRQMNVLFDVVKEQPDLLMFSGVSILDVS